MPVFGNDLKRHGLAAALIFSSAFGAQTDVAAQERKRSVPSEQVPGVSVTSISGTQVFIGTEAGYDSNLDNDFKSPHASAYEMLQAGALGSFKTDEASSYSYYLRGRNYWYNDLEDGHRYDIDAAFGAKYDLSKTTALKLGTSYYRDAISEDRINLFKSFADIVNEGETYRFRLRGDSRTEISFDEDDEQGTLDRDVFDVSRSRAFDFTKNGATPSLLLRRKEMFAPFVIANYTNIDYIHQAEDPSIDRDANEVWGVAGVRVTLSPEFHVDLGARHNHREFDDDTTTEFDSTFFDGRFTWKIAAGSTLRGTIERQIKEPSTSFGLADDVTTYEINFDQKIGELTLTARTYLDLVKPIGENFDYYKYNWSLGVLYPVTPAADLYVDYYGRYVEEKVRDESYDRYRLGAGVKIKF
jgi:hypothetical protein